MDYFTKAPWQIFRDPAKAGQVLICAEDKTIIAKVCHQWEDALLISSAPDLLEACRAALGAFENNNAIDWSDLERAIAKAEGRTTTQQATVSEKKE